MDDILDEEIKGLPRRKHILHSFELMQLAEREVQQYLDQGMARREIDSRVHAAIAGRLSQLLVSCARAESTLFVPCFCDPLYRGEPYAWCQQI